MGVQDVVVSWRTADVCSVVVGSAAFAGSRWRMAVVRRLSSAKLMRGDRSGFEAPETISPHVKVPPGDAHARGSLRRPCELLLGW